jgi:hypothetical protein
MYKRRLQKLADVLKRDADKKDGIKFNLHLVASRTGDIKQNSPLDCGTAACAIGLWGLCGEFKVDGVTHDRGWPLYRGYGGIVAARMYFGLTRQQSERLFLADSYPPEKRTGRAAELAVVTRIGRMVARA